MVFIIAGVEQNFLDVGHGIIGIDRGEMGEDLAAIQSFPQEGVAGKFIELVPGHFLGEEVTDAGLLHDLGQGGRIAKNIRHPEFLAGDPKLGLEEALSEQELADQRFAGRKVGIRLNPRAAGGHETPFARPGFDLLVQVRVLVFHPFILLGLGTGEYIIGVIFHIAHGGGEGAHAFAHGFGQGPEPGGVDMGMADGRELVLAIAIVGGEELRGDAPAGLPGGGILQIDGVDHGIGSI